MIYRILNTKQKQLKKDTPEEQKEPVDLSSFIIEQVTEGLGSPKNLNFIRASNVFDNRWRVDVWCYYNSTNTIMPTKCSNIFHSYFVHVDGHGKITKSDPEIKKEY